MLISVHAGPTMSTHSEISISFRIPFIVLMTLMVVFIMVALSAFIALLIREKRKAAIPPAMESVTTVVYEDIDPRPLPMNSNPAYKTVNLTEGPGGGDTA